MPSLSRLPPFKGKLKDKRFQGALGAAILRHPLELKMVVIGDACRALPNLGSQEVASSFQPTNVFHQDLLSFEARDASKIGRIWAGMTA